jgi:hypothetical protein
MMMVQVVMGMVPKSHPEDGYAKGPRYMAMATTVGPHAK